VIAFFDANALIYLIEGQEPFARQVRRKIEALSQSYPGIGTALSRLSWLECRLGPMKADDQITLSRFDAFFSRPDLIWIELDRHVVELATLIRARHGLRTPDALQAASCLQLGQDHVLLTGDAAFERVPGLHVERLKQTFH